MKKTVVCVVCVLVGSMSLLSCAQSDGEPSRVKSFYTQNATEIFSEDRQAQQLAWAASRGQLDRIERLVAEGADVNFRGYAGLTPIWWAMQRQNFEGFKKLLEVGADPNLDMGGRWGTLMHWTSRLEDTRYFIAAVEYGGLPDMPADGIERTPLSIAISYPQTGDEQVEIIKVLLELSVNVNFQSSTGHSPLLFAVYNGYYKIAKLLVEAGADPTLMAGKLQQSVLKIIQNRGFSTTDPEQYTDRDKFIAVLKERGYEIDKEAVQNQ